MIPTLVFGQAGSAQHPNFEGIWNSATATPLERPRELKDKPFFTPEEAAHWERAFAKQNEEPPPGAKLSGTGTYNTVYREWGTRTVKTRRTSIITEPADGRIPALTPAAAEVKRRRLEGLKKFENPEDLGLQDQCLAFLTAGPPMLPYSYNSNYQIVQTNDTVLVHAEMIHDARIIHLDGRPHAPARLRSWLGDSIGFWDNQKLVIHTTQLMARSLAGNLNQSEQMETVEIWEKIDPKTVEAKVWIYDPTIYLEPWYTTRRYDHVDNPAKVLRMNYWHCGENANNEVFKTPEGSTQYKDFQFTDQDNR
jgi:hypothetical protein